MMEMNCIPYNILSLYNIRDELSCTMAISTCTKVLCNLNRGPRTCFDKHKCNCQLLTVTPKHVFVNLLCHIMQNKAHVGNIPFILHLPSQRLQCFINFIILRMLFVICNELMNHVIYLDQGSPKCHF